MTKKSTGPKTKTTRPKKTKPKRIRSAKSDPPKDSKPKQGRGKGGLFAKGNTYSKGHGRPRNQLLAKLRRAAEEEITVEDVINSEVLAYPVHRLDISPTSDGAVAVVLAAEHVARRITDNPVWIDGVGYALDTAYWCTRDLCYPEYLEVAARQAYKMAGIREPHKEIDIAEPYDPFTYKELHHMEGLMLCGKGEAQAAGRRCYAKRRKPSCMSFRRTPWGRQPHCCSRFDEDCRNLPTAQRRGW